MPKKKVLIVSYYWPPAGGPGVQRWLKFIKYLPEFGINPTLYIPKNPSYPIIDDSLKMEVPENITILKNKIWEPYALAEKLSGKNKKYKAGQFDSSKNQSFFSRLSIWIRGNFFIPDARKFWIKPSIKYISKYLESNHFDAIITTGPPHSMHLIGLGLKKKHPHLRWIADFRDPWTEISYYQHLKLSNWADKKHKALEKEVFETADLTIATSPSDSKNFKLAGANAVCITNGFDMNWHQITEQVNNRIRSEKFKISYIGVLEQLRNPKILWQALLQLVSENKDFKEALEIRFVGKVDDIISNELESSHLKTHITKLGYVPHHKALKEMQSASVLMLSNFPNEKSKGILPGKLYEYLTIGVPIISFGPKDGDVKSILEQTSAGKHFTYDELASCKSYLLELFELWQQGKEYVPTIEIMKYSREALTKELADFINSE